MKGFGTLLAIIGVVALIAGIYGYVQLSNEGISGSDFDAIAGLASAFGVTGTLGASDSFQLWIIRNRTLLAFGGVIAAIIGFVIRRYDVSKSGV